MYFDLDDDEFGFPFWWASSLPTVIVSIDFVDYLIAKIFCQIVEDWFDSLIEFKSKKWISKLAKSPVEWEFVFDKLGLIGIAGFVFMFLHLENGKIVSIGAFAYLSSTVILMSCFSSVAMRYLGSRFTRSLHLSAILSMVILTRGDEAKAQRVLAESNASFKKLATHSIFAAVNVSLNILASYLYSWLTKS